MKINVWIGEFALKSLANGLYVRAVAPPADHYDLPWKLVIGGPSIGAAERFRLTEDLYLYSDLIGGFFSCASNDMIKATSGRYGNYNRFLFEPISTQIALESQKLVHLSDQIIKIQNEYNLKNQLSLQQLKSASNLAKKSSNDNLSPFKICIGVPVTSKGK